MTLVLVRHAESEWNALDLFTGWTDVELSINGKKMAEEMANLFIHENLTFDFVFTSNLIRAIDTARYFDENSTTISAQELRERDYGALTGMNKKEAEQKLGSDTFFKIRRGYYERPENGESLEDVVKRVGLFYEEYIKKKVASGKNVAIVAHGNSLRALLVHIGIFTPENISSFEIQSCVPIMVDCENKEITYVNKYKFDGLQILDSRGYPTIQVTCKNKLTGKIVGKGSTPSGASCGSTEVLELRDENKNYFMGKSVLKAIDNLNLINRYIPLNDSTISNLKLIDSYLVKLDPSETKEKLGGNTTTAVSFCVANVCSKINNIEMYEYISSTYNDGKIGHSITPFVNIINGGKHSVTGDLKVQEFMIFPNETYPSYKKVQIVTEVYHSLKNVLCQKYGESAKCIGDEGGFCPPVKSNREAIENIILAISKIGYIPGSDVFLALDCASSEFYNEFTELYEIEKGIYLNRDELIEYYGKLIEEYPMLKSIEDGFHEKDYDGWQKFTALYGDKIMIVGDDLFTTNSKLIENGLKLKLANSLLLKVNQIGTISEAIQSAKLFDNSRVIVSHRSGETNHSYIIDIAKGIGAAYVKIGSPCRGERVEKFNRLLEIN